MSDKLDEGVKSLQAIWGSPPAFRSDVATRVAAAGIATLIAVATLSLATPALARGGGAVLPNADIRALEPPIDVRESQLQAQAPPTPRHASGPIAESGARPQRHRRHGVTAN